jgi:Na+/H+ antiporter NhaD and related arsenite permeases
VRIAILGAGLLVVGAVAIATGVLPPDDALAVADRVWPVLLFAVAITIVAELAAEAGVFTALAERLPRVGFGRAWLLWLLVVVLAVVSTIFLSLDTTAVLLTPVVVLVARHHGLPALPFALTTVWLANTASLLLPVSNLTNLLALHALGSPDPASFAALMIAPALVAVVVPCVAIAVIARRSLATRYVAAAIDPVPDRALFWVAAAVLAALLPLLVSGMPVWIPACVAAVVLAAAFLARRRSALRWQLVPWQIVVFASGLFLVVEAAHAVGLTTVLVDVAGSGEDPGALLHLAFAGLVGANAIDNLPAYLALEPVAGSPVRLAALLVGVNAGPLITPWASLAVLLWHRRLVALGVELRWSRYVLLGIVVAPVTVALATLALAASQG